MKNYITSVFLLLITAQTISQSIDTEVYKRAKIGLNETHSLSRLNDLGIAADHSIQRKNQFIISDFSNTELEVARSQGYEVEIIIEDVKQFYRTQNERTSQALPSRNPSCDDTSNSYTPPVNFNEGSMGGYLTYQELLDELDDMAAQFPNLITLKSPISDFLTEGTPDNSVTPSIGSNPIYWLKISDNPNSDAEGEPQVLYTSIHHAREPMSLMQLVFYMWYLLENYDTDAEIQAIVDNTELYFVPVINPDGYLYNQVTDPNGGGLWRKNRKNGYGVDNNRNYDYHINGDPTNGSWGGPGSSSNTNSQVHHGSGPFSEVENQAIKWFVEQHEFVLAFNNHTSGRLFYYPFGYADVATPDDDIYQGIGAEISSRNGYTPLRDSPFAGESDDFMYGTVGTHNKIFAFTPEIGTSFWPPASSIIPDSQGMMFANITLAQMANNYARITDTSPEFVSSTAASASFDLTRLGINGTGDFEISINPISTNIIDASTAAETVSLDLLETGSGNLSYNLAATINSGDTIVYELQVDTGTFTYSIEVSKTFGDLTQIFLENGDSSTDQFSSNDWGTTNTTFVSPSSSITDSPTGNYDNFLNSSIALSDPIDLTSATSATVGYFARWEIENTWDYVQFEISTDGGANWEPQCGNFTTAGTNIQPIGEPLYDGTQNDWVREDINLSDYLGETILARFQLVTDNTETRDGFYFDDLEFSIIEENLSLEEDAFAKAFTLYPNPTNNNLNIQTNIGSYTVDIYNLLGQKVGETYGLSGNSTVNLSNYQSGIYLLEITSDIEKAFFKIVKN